MDLNQDTGISKKVIVGLVCLVALIILVSVVSLLSNRKNTKISEGTESSSEPGNFTIDTSSFKMKTMTSKTLRNEKERTKNTTSSLNQTDTSSI